MRLLLSWAVAMVVASPLGAKTVKVPEKEPVFSFNLPEGWTLKSGTSGDVECTAGDGSNFSFFFADYQNSFKDVEELKGLIAMQAKAVADGAKEIGSDVSIPPMQEKETMGKVHIFSVTLRISVPGEADMVQVFGGFQARVGRYFLLGTAASADVYKAHEKEMNDILDSTRAVEKEE